MHVAAFMESFMKIRTNTLLLCSLFLASVSAMADCVGYTGPGGACSTGPGGGLYTGPGGGAYTGPGGGGMGAGCTFI